MMGPNRTQKNYRATPARFVQGTVNHCPPRAHYRNCLSARCRQVARERRSTPAHNRDCCVERKHSRPSPRSGTALSRHLCRRDLADAPRNARVDALADLGIHYPSQDDVNTRVLRRVGVPAKAIRVLDAPMVNTDQELDVIGATLQNRGGQKSDHRDQQIPHPPRSLVVGQVLRFARPIDRPRRFRRSISALPMVEIFRQPHPSGPRNIRYREHLNRNASPTLATQDGRGLGR
jgi:hypothetical protein